MSSIDLVVIAVYISRLHLAGGLAGIAIQRVEGLFPGREQHPRLGGDDLDRRDGDEHGDFLERPWASLTEAISRTCNWLSATFLGELIVATVLLPAYFRGKILTAYELLQDRFGGPTRTTASLLFLVARSLGDGLRLFLAATVLRHLTGWSTGEAIVAVAAVTVIYTFLGGMKAVIWTDVIQFSVYILGGACGPDDPCGQASRRLVRAGPDGAVGREIPAPGFLARPHPPVHVLGGTDRRDGAEHGDSWGRPDDGPALSLGTLATAGCRGPDGQRPRDPRPVRLLPPDRRQPLGVLSAVSPLSGTGPDGAG